MTLEISILSNGLTVVSDPMPTLESAAIGIWVNTGSRNEAPSQMGVSHMLEHMAFKGTASRNARAIAEEIEAVGGILNAYTGREQTAFHARILKDDVPLALDIIADILTSPSFEPSELERERQVVLQELGQARDTPDDIVFDHLQSAIFKDQPLGWPILGEEKTVNAFSRQILKDYMASQYRLEGMTLVASGAVDHAAILRLAEETCGGLNPGQVPDCAPAHYVGGDFRAVEDLEQAHVAYAFPGLANPDADYFVAQVYATALGGGTSSRLFQEVREKRGLCYSVYAFSTGFQDSGFLGIYAGTGEAEAGELSAVIAGEMEAMTRNLSDSEVARARAQLKVSLLMGMERPGTRAEQIAGQMFALGKVQSAAEIVAQLDAIDAAAVKTYAARVIEAGHPTIAAVGPVTKLEPHHIFARRFGAARAKPLPDAAE
ncbi:MAG TPA: pitrilysin family protein [Rhizomicrobium sp.]|jgi:predicted Zn-dependent peptidase|nr:pitrilysin family protein [Rhizomicrobium sp.]